MTEKSIIEFIKSHFNKEHKGKHFLLMLFQTEMELGLCSMPNRWVCTNVLYFDNGTAALNAYANIPNPASQLVDGYCIDSLTMEALKICHGMKDEKWLEKNLYPYL